MNTWAFKTSRIHSISAQSTIFAGANLVVHPLGDIRATQSLTLTPSLWIQSMISRYLKICTSWYSYSIPSLNQGLPESISGGHGAWNTSDRCKLSKWAWIKIVISKHVRCWDVHFTFHWPIPNFCKVVAGLTIWNFWGEPASTHDGARRTLIDAFLQDFSETPIGHQHRKWIRTGMLHNIIQYILIQYN